MKSLPPPPLPPLLPPGNEEAVDPIPSEPLDAEVAPPGDPDDPLLPLEPPDDPELTRLVELFTEREVLALALPLPPVEAIKSLLPELDEELPPLLDCTVTVALDDACNCRVPPPPMSEDAEYDPRLPRSCGAMIDTNVSAPVTPLNRIVCSRLPDVAVAVLTNETPAVLASLLRLVCHHNPPAAIAARTRSHRQ